METEVKEKKADKEGKKKQGTQRERGEERKEGIRG